MSDDINNKYLNEAITSLNAKGIKILTPEELNQHVIKSNTVSASFKVISSEKFPNLPIYLKASRGGNKSLDDLLNSVLELDNPDVNAIILSHHPTFLKGGMVSLYSAYLVQLFEH